MKITGYSYKDQPTHTHDCENCSFLFGINYHNGHKIIEVVDVYSQCGKKETTFLIRFSSIGYDYTSGADLKQVVAGYAKQFLRSEE